MLHKQTNKQTNDVILEYELPRNRSARTLSAKQSITNVSLRRIPQRAPAHKLLFVPNQSTQAINCQINFFGE
jgi:hypothetical protein